MTTHDILPAPRLKIGDLVLRLDRRGAAYIENMSILLVADLHLEKATALAKRTSHLLPPYDSRATLLRLVEVADIYRPQKIIFLGDTWHDRHGLTRMIKDDRLIFDTLLNDFECLFIVGNHDPDQISSSGLRFMNNLEIGNVILRHNPDIFSPNAEICGHLHPVIRIKTKGKTLRRPCFVGTDFRLILPAFGAYTGGLNCLDPAISSLFEGHRVRYFALGQKNIYEIGTQQLLND